MIPRAINQKTLRRLSFEAFLDAAQSLGCVGVEARDDLGRPFFDGIAPEVAGRMVCDRGLRLLGLSEVYGFNVWSEERAAQIAALADVAERAGAETISLIPTVDDRPTRPLPEVMADVAKIMAGRAVVPLIEPIGFAGSSLRGKAELAEAITAAPGNFRMVHDTFQHQIADEAAFFAPLTAMVHISGISQPGVALDAGQDGHRVLVDAQDRCGNLHQIAALLKAGYRGAFSFECTQDTLLQAHDLVEKIARSFDFIDRALAVESNPGAAE